MNNQLNLFVRSFFFWTTIFGYNNISRHICYCSMTNDQKTTTKKNQNKLKHNLYHIYVTNTSSLHYHFQWNILVDFVVVVGFSIQGNAAGYYHVQHIAKNRQRERERKSILVYSFFLSSSSLSLFFFADRFPISTIFFFCLSCTSFNIQH